MLNPEYLNDHQKYQTLKCSSLSDEELFLGFIEGNSCDAEHWESERFVNFSKSDQCFIFRYSNGRGDHFCVRWFKDWCQQNRPKLYNKIITLEYFL